MKSNIIKAIYDEKLNYNYGIYAIINHTLKCMYIGSTKSSFLNRWIGHIESEALPIEFLNHKDTEFIVIHANCGKATILITENRYILQYIKEYPEYSLLNQKLN